MTYATVETQARKAKIGFQPTNFGKTYKELFDQTDASGFELFVLDSHNNYDNAFHKSREDLYKQRGRQGFGLITRDIVREGKGADDKGRLNVSYVSQAGTQWEKVHDNVWMPKNGWYVPTGDGLFHEGTLVAFETVEDRNEAIRRLEKAGIPGNMVSYSYRLDDYRDEMLVDVYFYPNLGVHGRFDVRANGPPSDSGCGWVASLPAYKDEPAFEASSLPVAGK